MERLGDEEPERKGELPGPGIVSYSLHHAGQPGSKLRVRGVLFADPEGKKLSVLKATDVTTMSPEEPAAFQYEVTPAEFSAWTKKFGTLRIGLDYEPESRQSKGKWVDATEGDAVLTETIGKFLVKSTYHPSSKREVSSPAEGSGQKK